MSAPILKISGMDISINATDIPTNMRMQDKLEIIAKKLERIPYRSRIYLFSEKTRDFWKELSWISDIPEIHIIQFLKEKIDNDQSDKEIEYMVEIIRIDRLENWFMNDHISPKLKYFEGRVKLRIAMARANADMCKKCTGVAIVNHLFSMEAVPISSEIMNILGAKENSNGILCINTEELFPTDDLTIKFEMLKEKLRVLDPEQRKNVFCKKNKEFWEKLSEVCFIWYSLMKVMVGDE